MKKLIVNKKNLFLVILIFLSINFRRIDELTGLPGGSESIIYFGFNLLLLFNLMFFKRRLPRLKFENKLFLFWLIWVILVSNFNDSVYVVKDFWAEVRNIILALLTFVNVSYYIDKSNLKLAIRTFIISTFFLSFIILVNSGSHSFTSESRLENSYGLNPNELAYYVSLAFSLLFIYKNVYSKKYILVFIAFFFFLTIILASRKAILSQVAFVSLLYTLNIFSNKKSRIKNFIALISFITIIVVLGSYILANSFMGERLQRTKSIEEFSENEYQRVEHYQNFIPYLKEAPLTGIGLLETLNRSTYKKGSHSEYISIINETGIIGGLLYFGIYFYLFHLVSSSSRNQKPEDKYLKSKIIAAIIFLLLFSIGRWNYTTSAHFSYLAILYAYCRSFSGKPTIG